MLIVYFGLWILLNGRVDGDVLLSGAVASVLVYGFTRLVVRLTPGRQLRGLKRCVQALRYVGTLFVEVYKANWALLRLLFDPRRELEPQLLTVKTDLTEDMTRVALANSITLTPGTITVSQAGDTLIVHAIDTETAKGLLEDNVFTQSLREMEAKE